MQEVIRHCATLISPGRAPFQCIIKVLVPKLILNKPVLLFLHGTVMCQADMSGSSALISFNIYNLTEHLIESIKQYRLILFKML